MILRLLLVGAFACLASTATADFVSGGTGGAIPDPGSVDFDTPTITQNETIERLSVTIFDFRHTWVGDLIGTLTHVDTGTEVTMFSRVRRWGTNGSGDSSNVNGEYTFDDAGGDFWSEAGNGSSNYSMAPGMYQATNEQGSVVSLSSAFNGESTAGTWRLTIQDADLKEVGSFGSWQINFSSSIPEPAGTGVLAILLGGIAFGRRRRT